MPEQPRPLLSFVVPSPGDMSELRFSAPPILAEEQVELVLVDSGVYSCPGHVARANWPAARVIDLPGPHPVDPGLAVRAGVQAAAAPYVVVLGAEVWISVPALLKVVERLEDGACFIIPAERDPVVVCRREEAARAIPEEGAHGAALCRCLANLGLKTITLDPGPFLLPEPAPHPPNLEIRMPNPVTIGVVGPALGDALKCVYYADWVRQTYRVDVSIYPNWHGNRGKDFQVEPMLRKEPLMREVLELFDLSSRFPVVSEVPIEAVYVPDHNLWHFPLLTSAKVRWQGWGNGLHRRIAYQLDGVSEAALKNPPPGELARLLKVAPGFEMVRLGKHLSLRQCAEAAAASDLFFGVDSGMLQLCYAVGVPVFLISYQVPPYLIFKWHGDRHAVWCRNTDDFVFKARHFLGLH